VYHKNGAAYAITRDCIINKKSIKGNKTSFILIKEFLPNIDTDFDLRLAEFILNSTAAAPSAAYCY
jgi:CMP-N-acetylneuraminic acid synthetase